MTMSDHWPTEGEQLVLDAVQAAEGQRLTGHQVIERVKAAWQPVVDAKLVQDTYGDMDTSANAAATTAQQFQQRQGERQQSFEQLEARVQDLETRAPGSVEAREARAHLKGIQAGMALGRGVVVDELGTGITQRMYASGARPEVIRTVYGSPNAADPLGEFVHLAIAGARGGTRPDAPTTSGLSMRDSFREASAELGYQPRP